MKPTRKNIRFTLACFMFFLLVTSCVWQMIAVNNREARKTNTYEIDIDNDGIIDAVVEGKLTVLSQDKPEAKGQNILTKISHYDPSLGGINCLNFVNGECVSPMANGEDWKDWIGKNNTIACPIELEFGTEIIIEGSKYTCRDRGGMIVYENGYFWIDILTKNPKYAYGTVIEAMAYIP